VRELLSFRGFTHDPQSILTAVQRLTFVGIESRVDGVFSPAERVRVGCKLRVTALTDAEQWDASGLLYDPQFALFHDSSLAHWRGKA
jgi:hypothetical protein